MNYVRAAQIVIPANAGTQLRPGLSSWGNWVPVFAGMTMLNVALAGCNKQVPTATVAPNPTQAAADAASTAYAHCVDRAATSIDVSLDQPAALADRAMKACIAERATAVAKVQAAEMARGGDPVVTAEVAERSLRVADDEIRDSANLAIVMRKYPSKMQAKE